MSSIANKGFLYPGINIDLRYRIDQRSRTRIGRQVQNSYYPIAISHEARGCTSPILQVREVAMMMLMDQITDKDKWYDKVFDNDIVNKWREESEVQSEESLFNRILSGKDRYRIPMPKSRIVSREAFEFCVSELRNKAHYFKKTGFIPTLDSGGNSIVKSDTVVPDDLHGSLVSAFDELKDAQSNNVDWHPWSNEMQQNLVHPSLYPLVYGTSRFIQDEIVPVYGDINLASEGTITPTQRTSEDIASSVNRHRYGTGSGKLLPRYWSSNFQWLPANVTFREDGTAQFKSYINNLDPEKHPDIYKTIEKLIDVAIPAWDQVLRECHTNKKADCVSGRRRPRFHDITGASDEDESLWQPFDVKFWLNSSKSLSSEELKRLEEDCFYDEDEHSETAYDDFNKLRKENTDRRRNGLPPSTPHVTEERLARAKWEKYRDPIYPEPMSFEEIDYTPPQRLREQFGEHGLQIIVKMASIELTPEKPEFPGGSWHIEGQMNERICATALYYVDCENITPSQLSFRMQTDAYLADHVYAGQDQYNWLERVYGTNLGVGINGACLQTYGDVKTSQGRMIAFPNVFHHRVSDFELKDPTKPGRRRFIALWLVDPHQRIISTANVPPQQKDWWDEMVGDGVRKYGFKTPEGLMTLDEAKGIRLKLMEERSIHEEGARGDWDSVTYGFCEH